MKFPNPFKKLFHAFSPKETAPPPDPAEIVVTGNETGATNSFLHPQIQTNMAMYNFGVGGNEVKVDANDAINEIQHNKTLLVNQLTTEDPVQPETVSGLKTVEDVFRHFRPGVAVEMENAAGETVKEQLRFNNLGDFTPKRITAQSEFLNNLNISQEQYAKIMKQLQSNRVLKSMLTQPETKEAMITALKQLSEELAAQQ